MIASSISWSLGYGRICEHLREFLWDVGCWMLSLKTRVDLGFSLCKALILRICDVKEVSFWLSGCP